MIEDKKISEQEMGQISGGMVVEADARLPEYDPAFPYEVVENNNCRVLGKFSNQAAACHYAKSFGPEAYNAQLTDVNTVLRLRANPQGNG